MKDEEEAAWLELPGEECAPLYLAASVAALEEALCLESCWEVEVAFRILFELPAACAIHLPAYCTTQLA